VIARLLAHCFYYTKKLKPHGIGHFNSKCTENNKNSAAIEQKRGIAGYISI